MNILSYFLLLSIMHLGCSIRVIDSSLGIRRYGKGEVTGHDGVVMIEKEDRGRYSARLIDPSGNSREAILRNGKFLDEYDSRLIVQGNVVEVVPRLYGGGNTQGCNDEYAKEGHKTKRTIHFVRDKLGVCSLTLNLRRGEVHLIQLRPGSRFVNGTAFMRESFGEITCGYYFL